MLRRITAFFHQDIGGLHRAAYLLASLSLVSQLLAIVRDRIFAHVLGAGETLDVYYAAFRVPDLLFVGVASMVSLSVLIPFLAERVHRSHEDAKAFFDRMFSVYLGSMCVFGSVAFFAMPFLAHFFFGGFSEAVIVEKLIPLTRLLLVQAFIIGFSGLLASVTQLYKRFLIYALSPALYNVGIIFGILFLYKPFGIMGLGIGVVIGSLLHIGIQVPFIISSRFFPIPRRINVSEIASVLRVSLPRTLALSAQQITLFALLSMASHLREGSIAVFTLGFNIQSVPLAIIGASYSTAIFPRLAGLFARGKIKAFRENVSSAMQHIALWAFPATVLFIVLRAHIVRVLLGTGAFDWTDTRLTAAILAIFSFSIFAQSLILLLSRSYYASGETRKPFVINICSALVTVSLAYFFMRDVTEIASTITFLARIGKIHGVAGMRVVALPFAYSIGVILNAMVLTWFFHRDFGRFPTHVWRSLFQTVSASCIAGLGAYVLLKPLHVILNTGTFFGIGLQGALAGLSGIGIYYLVLHFFKNEEVIALKMAIRRRLRRKNVL